MAFRWIAALICIVIGAATTQAQDDWYPSKYGAEDTLGAINNLSAEGVVRAAELVKTGRTYSLGIVTGRQTPAYGTRTFQLFSAPSGDGSGATLGSNSATGNDDLLITWLGIGTQLDGLGHLGINHRYYNGVHASDFVRPDGLARFGTHLVPPIVTRGVLLDIAALQDVDLVPGGTAINRAEIDAAAARQGLTLSSGDVVLLHTGWGAVAEQSSEMFLRAEPGLGKEGARYLAGLGVVAVGSDGWGLEVIPHEDESEAFPVHQILLARNGVYILENVNTAELARDRTWEFLFVLGQPKFEGAVQMVVNPVAIR